VIAHRALATVSTVNEVHTRRLVGAPLAPANFAEIRLLHGDPRVMATLSADGNILTDAQTHAFLDRAARHWELYGFGLWLFRDAHAAEFVGYGGIKHAVVEGTDQVELSYAVRFDSWGNGFAVEMSDAALTLGFEQLHLERIVAFTLPHNRRSRRVMENCGFTFQRDITHAGLLQVLYALDARTFAARSR
jgi:[ribosomal protein S5]-alanine N-acetyltransferase